MEAHIIVNLNLIPSISFNVIKDIESRLYEKMPPQVPNSLENFISISIF